ncbi:hypothetical protein AIOL_003020 [Candidatus Rhodobacter oscarellae]|uniref:RecA/RadA recombinase n=1 Tax=Candidatus Rhodobacter oscarellae TaxID=1675527 RepID=A0A0J9E5L4_9RHOB|nr:hypothetical protein [Candidatus Rhodobacter lobularis]KMW58050.1 hypothetical protein AIOL_003020 [Candidatus Rhodobacter lobularis]
MTSQLLNRATHRRPARPELPFLGDLSLSLGRAHELCGPARRTLAAMIAARSQGPVFWIAPAWQAERLNPEGLCHLVEPGRVTFLDPLRGEDLLWCMEEVLRAGAVPLVVLDLPGTPGLTPVRRLHLAAETGREISGAWPLGLILTPGAGGAQGIESRWQMTGDHGAEGRRAWRLDRLRARTAPRQSWHVTPRNGQLQLTPAPDFIP